MCLNQTFNQNCGTMKKYLSVLLLLNSFFSVDFYAQNTSSSSNDLHQNTTSLDEDAMSWELSYDFMGISKRATQATCTTDVTPPTIFCPQDVFAQATGTNCGIVVSYPSPSVSDNCPGLSLQCNPPSWSYFSAGTNTVTCIATDASNNSASCTFDVFVSENIPPTFTFCPQDIFVQATSTCGAFVNFSPYAIDNCSGTSYECFPSSGSLFPNGMSTVFCTATDVSDNTDFCTFNVSVSSNIPPVITCPQDIFVQGTNTSDCGAVLDYPFPSVSCPGVAIQCDPPPWSFFSAGTTTVTCTATDGANNTDVCTFDIIVPDNEPPFIACPGDVVVQPDPNTCTAVVFWADPIVLDNCGNDIVSFCQPLSGSTFSAGTSTVFCVTYDGYNTSTCEFDILVTDDCFANCPPTITFNNTTVTGLHQAQISVTALNTITTGTSTSFKAGNVIKLFNGFTTPSSVDFSAEIEDCTPNVRVDGDQN